MAEQTFVKEQTKQGKPIYLAIPERIERDGDYFRASNAWKSAAAFAQRDGDMRSARRCLANARRCKDLLKGMARLEA